MGRAAKHPKGSPVKRMPRVQNLDLVDRGFVRLTTGDIPVGLRVASTTAPGSAGPPRQLGRATQTDPSPAAWQTGTAPACPSTAPSANRRGDRESRKHG